MEEKKYINIDNMATRLCQILKDARESMVDDKNKDFIMENFSVNNDDEIEEDFLNFPAGTLKIDVWHWFDERCPNNLHDDLMYFKNDAV